MDKEKDIIIRAHVSGVTAEYIYDAECFIRPQKMMESIKKSIFLNPLEAMLAQAVRLPNDAMNIVGGSKFFTEYESSFPMFF